MRTWEDEGGGGRGRGGGRGKAERTCWIFWRSSRRIEKPLVNSNGSMKTAQQGQVFRNKDTC